MKKLTGWKPIPREEPHATGRRAVVPFACWLAPLEELQNGTTEHTETTEARDNRPRIRFRVFGVFCG